MKKFLITLSSLFIVIACTSNNEKATDKVTTVEQESAENPEIKLVSLVENPAPPDGETFEKIDFRLGGQIEIPTGNDWKRKDISELLEQRKLEAEKQGLTNGDLQEWYNEKMDATIMIQDISLSDDYTNDEGLKIITDYLLAANKRDAESFSDVGHKVGKIGLHTGVQFDGKFDNGKPYVTRDYALGSTTKGSMSIQGRCPTANAKYIQQLIDYMAYTAGE